ncbi:NAD(P)/FAD-dependent oxidoreductase [uncultured Anaerococcus sp.]|uniref:NAD(P)/FAD-dependent oxidoreductase n=1 Tax=uncultured Anaerococcus sp. TaxID=293428 RepID=UPI0026017063|nr:FAD-dependent oxidoreductase [uncultured Anaerococcus sp.]
MKRIILAGGGHGHINILKNLLKEPLEDFEILLITDNKKQYYSGMLAGFLEGIYKEDEVSFDVEKLCKLAGVHFINDKITEIDKRKEIVKTEKNSYSYDYLSVNLGSSSDLSSFDINSSNISLVKPISNVIESKEYLRKDILSKDSSYKLFFIGGGPSGVELALAFRSAYKNIDISIITADEIFAKYSKSAQKRIKKILKKKNINLIENKKVLEIKDDNIITDGKIYSFDYAFVTTGFKGPDIDFKNFETYDNNFLKVDDKLTAADNVLAMGDVATIDKYPRLPKAGVFAIRQAPFLYNNLKKIINNKVDLETYEPNKYYLQIINCGNKKGLAMYANMAFYGKIPWMIKDKIDSEYMIVE